MSMPSIASFCRTATRLALVAPLLAASAASAQVDPEARAIIEEARDAWRALDSMAAEVSVAGTGAIGAMASPKVDASLIMLRDPNNPGFWLHRVTGSGLMPGQKESTSFDAAWDPEQRRVTWIDHSEKVVNAAPRGSGSAFTIATAAVPAELVTATAFEEDLRGSKMVLENPVEVGGVMCDVVKVTHANGMSTVRWFIGRDDNLPRKHANVFETGPVQGTIERTFAGVEANPRLRSVAFTIDQPEGYALNEVATPTPIEIQPLEDTRLLETERSVNTVRSGRKQAMDFTLLDPDGISVALSEYRGQVVLLDFWGTWCLPCKKATPYLQKLHEDYVDKSVRIFGLACRERDRQAPIDYFAENELGYTLLLDADDVAKQMEVKGYPTYILIDANGGIIETWVGGNPETVFEDIRQKIDVELSMAEDNGAPPAMDSIMDRDR